MNKQQKRGNTPLLSAGRLAITFLVLISAQAAVAQDTPKRPPGYDHVDTATDGAPWVAAGTTDYVKLK